MAQVTAITAETIRAQGDVVSITVSGVGGAAGELGEVDLALPASVGDVAAKLRALADAIEEWDKPNLAAGSTPGRVNLT